LILVEQPFTKKLKASKPQTVGSRGPLMPRLQLSHILPFIQGLSAESLNSRHKTNVHIAFVFNSRLQLLGWSLNKVGTRSHGSGYSDNTIHAERAALKRVGDMNKLRGASLVVVRLGRDGHIKYSEPCCECRRHLDKCIRDYGLRYVYYS
jgi:hypothetical protein